MEMEGDGVVGECVMYWRREMVAEKEGFDE